jgi:hypothetical protein
MKGQKESTLRPEISQSVLVPDHFRQGYFLSERPVDREGHQILQQEIGSFQLMYRDGPEWDCMGEGQA